MKKGKLWVVEKIIIPIIAIVLIISMILCFFIAYHSITGYGVILMSLSATILAIICIIFMIINSKREK